MAVTETHEQFASGVKENQHGVVDVFNNAFDEIFPTA
jgi:hypothetical protein